jgi:hypothetical protein
MASKAQKKNQKRPKLSSGPRLLPTDDNSIVIEPVEPSSSKDEVTVTRKIKRILCNNG